MLVRNVKYNPQIRFHTLQFWAKTCQRNSLLKFSSLLSYELLFLVCAKCWPWFAKKCIYILYESERLCFQWLTQGNAFNWKLIRRQENIKLCTTEFNFDRFRSNFMSFLFKMYRSLWQATRRRWNPREKEKSYYFFPVNDIKNFHWDTNTSDSLYRPILWVLKTMIRKMMTRFIGCVENSTVLSSGSSPSDSNPVRISTIWSVHTLLPQRPHLNSVVPAGTINILDLLTWLQLTF